MHYRNDQIAHNDPMLKTLCINRDGTFHDLCFEISKEGCGSVYPFYDGKRYLPVGYIHNRMIFMEGEMPDSVNLVGLDLQDQPSESAVMITRT
jgi:hypothetical protein